MTFLHKILFKDLKTPNGYVSLKYPWPPNIYSRVCLDLTRWNKAYKQPGLTEYVPYSVTAPTRSLWDAESYTSEEEYLFSSLYWRRLGWDKAMKEKNGRKQIVRNKAPPKNEGDMLKKNSCFRLYLCWSLQHLQILSQAVQSTSPLKDDSGL